MEAVERAFVDAAGDRSHGATAIERRLLERLIATDAPNPTAIARGARALRHGQPAMGNLVSLASRALDADVASFLDWAALRLEILRDLNERLAIAAWPVVRRAEVVVTVSRSSSVAAVVRGAAARGWSGRVVVLDGAPSGRGPDQARQLVRTGIDAVSQPDAVALSWLSAGTVAVVGADAVGPSSFVNAVGTRVLLESARRRRRRTLLVADRGKVVDGADVRRLLAAVPRAGREGSARRWPVFEEIPLRLVDEQVDEVGLFQVCSSGDRQSV